MRRRPRWAIAWLVGVLLSAASVADETGWSMERPPWAACTYCHGEQGEGARGGLGGPPVPAIGGRSAPVLRALIESFRDGSRQDPNRMMGIVRQLSPADIDEVVGYFATRPQPAEGLTR